MIHFACPRCLATYSVPDGAAGKKSTCRKCGQRLRVPPLVQPVNKTVLGQPVLDSAPSSGPTAVPVTCRSCGKGFGLPGTQIGTGHPILCPHCGHPCTGRQHHALAIPPPLPPVRHPPADYANLAADVGRLDEHDGIEHDEAGSAGWTEARPPSHRSRHNLVVSALTGA
jgi:DNA-directed RNA polymerase subunit RPC12/RpoP